MDKENSITQNYCIRITLTSTDLAAIEKVSTSLMNTVQEKLILIKGPIRIPTKIMNIVTRQSPCSNGTSTFEYFDMYVFKRLLDIDCVSTLQRLGIARDITATSVESGVEIDVTLHEFLQCNHLLKLYVNIL